MEIRRFYGTKKNNIIVLEGDEFFHCIKVLRHRIGYEIVVFTGDGFDYNCRIIKILEDSVEAEILSHEKNQVENKWKIILCQGLCKEFDFIIQKAVELGVNKIIPFLSSRTNIKNFKRIRAEKIILDAVKQCGRAVIPEITEPIKYEELFNMNKNFKNRIICYEDLKGNSLYSQLNWVDRDVLIVIGSEGGFTEEEIRNAANSGLKIVSLGNRILKAETAAITGLITVLIKYDEI